MTSWRTAPLPRDWPTIRRRILTRDRHTCTASDCQAPATDVDHVVPAHLGGSDEDANLASLCGWHHRAKTAAEANAVGGPRRRGRFTPSRRSPERHPGLR